MLAPGVTEQELAGLPGASVGIVSASQGRYTLAQLLLDVGQGARIASTAYPGGAPPPALTLHVAGGRGAFAGWDAVLSRAGRAPQLLEPGLLASLAPRGAEYVGSPASASILGALAAADRRGNVAVSFGAPATLPARIAACTGAGRLVVADVPGGEEGLADLRTLIASRAPSELVVVLQRVAGGTAGQLLWGAVAGLARGGQGELTSASTGERGLIVSGDLTATILAHLGVRSLPHALRGKPLRAQGSLDGPGLRSLMTRLRVLGGRRLEALGVLLAAWAALALACLSSRPAQAWAMRVGGLGAMWAPVVVLLAAALQPSAPVECAIIAAGCLGLGALSDLLVPWPRAPLAPALAALVALTADALAGTQLLMRSLLGPDPILGARFYGFGNELKPALAVLALAAVAAALYPARRGRHAALAMAGAGVVVATIEGAARIGAGVGGAILVSVGFAVASILLLDGALTRRRALLVLLSPFAALLALAAIDLLTAHGTGHYTGSVLDARSAGELRDVIVRRYKAAWEELGNQAMPLASASALALAAVGLVRRRVLLAPAGADPAWPAAFAGGLAAALTGALVEDSGPVLLVVGVFVLGCVASYLWGGARLSARSPGTRRAARSRARGPRAAHVH